MLDLAKQVNPMLVEGNYFDPFSTPNAAKQIVNIINHDCVGMVNAAMRCKQVMQNARSLWLAKSKPTP